MSETKTKNLCTVPAADLTDSQYFIAEDGGELKRIPKAQVVLKKLENMLATDTENLAGGGEVTAQELLDVLAEQVANKLLAKSQVVNNLLATVEGNPLDATQGKALKDLIDTTNNNLSKKLFVKIGDTSNGNHSQIDQIADFYGITWVNSNYNSTFGGQWCFVDSTIIDNSGPYAMQRIMSCENAAILATRYCTKGTWGAWNVGVTKSDLSNRASYNSWVTDLDSAPDAIILRTNTDPTGYPTNLGGNSCLAFQLNPGTKYSAQLAFSFSKDRLAIRRKNNSDTWTAWKYVDFTIS